MIRSLGEYLKKVMLMFDEKVFRFVFRIKKLSVTHPVAGLKQVSFSNLDNIARGDSTEESSTRDLISSLRF